MSHEPNNGRVYKARLTGGKVIAFGAGDPVFDKCFKNEVQVLLNIRHRRTNESAPTGATLEHIQQPNTKLGLLHIVVLNDLEFLAYIEANLMNLLELILLIHFIYMFLL